MDEKTKNELEAIAARLDECEGWINKLRRRTRQNTSDTDLVAIAFFTFAGLLLVFAFGVQVKTEWFNFDLSGETFARIIEVSGMGAAVGAIVKYLIDRFQKSDEDQDRM